MSNYRKIYEQHHGPIPKGFHVHHKDMNHVNDDPLNLEALHPDAHAQKHGFLNNFIMASSTALERSHASRRKPENRAKMSLMKMGVWIGNKYALGSKGPIGVKRSKESNEANSLRAKAQWASMSPEEKETRKLAFVARVSVSNIGNTHALGKSWKWKNKKAVL